MARALDVANLVVQGTLGNEAGDIVRRHARAGRPAHVVHGEVLDAIERQAFERQAQRVRADVLEAVLSRDAGLHVDEAPGGKQVGVATRKDLQFPEPLPPEIKFHCESTTYRALWGGKAPHETSLDVLHLKLGVSSKLLIHMDLWSHGGGSPHDLPHTKPALQRDLLGRT